MEKPQLTTEIISLFDAYIYIYIKQRNKIFSKDNNNKKTTSQYSQSMAESGGLPFSALRFVKEGHGNTEGVIGSCSMEDNDERRSFV